MAIVYRPQRGGLKEAMAEAAAFENERELLAYVKRAWEDEYPEAKFVVKVRTICEEHIGWSHTRYVYMTDNGIDAPFRHPKVVGMCDSDTFKDMTKEEALSKAKELFEQQDR